jgi:HD-like signal output (HDOD) protein
MSSANVIPFPSPSHFETAPRNARVLQAFKTALATACHARVLAREAGADAPLLTGVGLLHRAGEITALRALAQAERETGQRLIGPVMREILAADDGELASRVTRSWGLPGGLRLSIIRWREEQESLNRADSVALLMLAQSLTTELVHASTCTPGLVEAACETLKLPGRLIARARAATSEIARFLEELAPLPA